MECPGAGPRSAFPSKPHGDVFPTKPEKVRGVLGSPSVAPARQGEPAGVWRDEGGEGRRRKEGKKRGEGGARGGARTTKAAPTLAPRSPGPPTSCAGGLLSLTWAPGEGAQEQRAGRGWKAQKEKTREGAGPGDGREPDLVLVTPRGNGWAGATCAPEPELERRAGLASPARSQPCLLIRFLPACISPSFLCYGGMFSPFPSWSWG